jgi:hypothetical protein
MSTPHSPPAPTASRRKTGIALGCIVVIAASGWWTWRTQFARPKAQEELHRMIGRVMAEETIRVLDGRGKILLIAIDTKAVPELKWQLDAFDGALAAASRITVAKTYDLETDGKTKYTFGSGLSGRRYVRSVNKNTGIDAVVSFAGAPHFKDNEEKELKFKPRLIAESRSPQKLKNLFEHKLIDVAVVSRFEFPNPVSGTPKNAREMFIQRFQVVTPQEAGKLPVGTEE